jgi:hypothetical protein
MVSGDHSEGGQAVQRQALGRRLRRGWRPDGEIAP